MNLIHIKIGDKLIKRIFNFFEIFNQNIQHILLSLWERI